MEDPDVKNDSPITQEIAPIEEKQKPNSQSEKFQILEEGYWTIINLLISIVCY